VQGVLRATLDDGPPDTREPVRQPLRVERLGTKQVEVLGIAMSELERESRASGQYPAVQQARPTDLRYDLPAAVA
jgi:hypothetical protein